MNVMKMFGTTTSSADSIATIDVPEDSVLEAILINMNVLGGADCGANVEISFSSSSGFNNNDTRASIAGAVTWMELTTQGATNTAKNIAITNLGVECNGGERLHLHVQELGVATSTTVSAWLYFRPKARRVSTVRRRSTRRTAA